ncbi:heterokaryon incompatibility protein-domain-containing protein [Annulohypoxylon stygium]|nr:heterokaryon incompatibility protein-domain-containing protein [Annulohypoxylon stygium]
MDNCYSRNRPGLLSTAALHSPLDTKQNQIRFIEILPSDTDYQPVRCLLKTMELTSDIRYAALSYVWGDRKVTQDIIVNEIEFPVTNNLASALWHFRKNGFPKHGRADGIRLLWVDAICINQDDVSERNHQLLLMGSIYRNAASTFSWLGAHQDIDHALGIIRDLTIDTRLGISSTSDCSQPDSRGQNTHQPLGDISSDRWGTLLVNQIIASASCVRQYTCQTVHRFWFIVGVGFMGLCAKICLQSPGLGRVLFIGILEWFSAYKGIHQDVTHMAFVWLVASFKFNLSDHDFARAWQPFFRLADSEYWTRVWVIQEMALARSSEDLWFVCGSSFVTYKEVMDFFSCLDVLAGRRLPKARVEYMKIMKHIWTAGKSPVMISRISIEMFSVLERLQSDMRNHSAEPNRALWRHIISTSAIASATDPRDMVYAVLGLVHSTIVPDYSKSVKEIYLDAVRNDGIKETMGMSLQFSGRGYGLRNDHELPSWLPDLSKIKENRNSWFSDLRVDNGPLLKDIKL